MQSSMRPIFMPARARARSACWAPIEKSKIKMVLKNPRICNGSTPVTASHYYFVHLLTLLYIDIDVLNIDVEVFKFESQLEHDNIAKTAKSGDNSIAYPVLHQCLRCLTKFRQKKQSGYFTGQGSPLLSLNFVSNLDPATWYGYRP